MTKDKNLPLLRFSAFALNSFLITSRIADRHPTRFVAPARRDRGRVPMSSMFKTLTAVQKALGALPVAMTPSRVNGKWHAPEFSRRKVAELRKAALSFDLDWVHDTARKPVRERMKGHKHDRDRPIREAKVAAALKKQPELVAAYRAKMKIKPTTLEKLTMSTAELVLKRRLAVTSGKK
jgi:hypothetical protein